MTADGSLTSGQSFDLSTLVRDLRSLQRGRRAFGVVGVVFGVGLTLAAVLLYARNPGSADPGYLANVVALGGSGVAVFFANVALLWGLERGLPTSLTIDPDGFVLRGPESSPTIDFRWSEPGRGMDLLDQHEIGPTRRDGRRIPPAKIHVLRRGEFMARWVPIPAEAAAVLLRQASEGHRTTVTSTRTPGGTRPDGTVPHYTWYTIRRSTRR